MSNAANTVSMNGQDRVLLPLNWKQLKERRDDIIVINKMKPTEGMFTEAEQEAILRVVHASLQRSDEAISLEYVEKNLDLGNVGDILKMVFGQKVQPKSGEAGAALSTS